MRLGTRENGVSPGFVSPASLAGVIVAACLVAAPGAEARQAALIVDANSGAVLHSLEPDAPRFPASLTKVMTLYLLFEQIDAGRLTMDSRLRVSANAARQPPTRLGVRAGDTIRVEDAVLALITRSANDVSVVVAENLAGSVEAFAARMTARARQLGMSRTTFRNPHGLPDPEQRTTARDMATLGRAVYERFPQFSRYFARRSFVYGRRTVTSHNRLVGRIQGVDGIKTGYTRASGFNLITSARVGGRHLVGVVMGGTTAASRDAHMARLVGAHLPRMATRRTDFSIAQRVRGRAAEPVVAAREVEEQTAPTPAPAVVAAREERPAPAPTPPPAPVAAERPAPQPAPQPQPVREERARPQLVSVPAPVPLAAPAVQTPVIPPAGPVRLAEPRREPQPAAQPVRLASAGSGPILQWQAGPSGIVREEPATTGAAPPRTAAAAVSLAASATPAAAAAPAAPALTGWAVQIAATTTESDAQRMLAEARSAVGRRLGNARPVTERVERNTGPLYRARFAGFSDRSAADAACQALRRNDYACMAVRL
jgi:D-alanyl-D-alanine carboxypeptidase